MDWQRLARANTHPLRISILEVLSMEGGRLLSPSDLSYELRTPLSKVNYHVMELAKSSLIELVSERAVRGATEHFYCVAQGESQAPVPIAATKSNGGRRTRGLEPARSGS